MEVVIVCIRSLAIIFLVVFLSGCATGRTGEDIRIRQLEGRISSLELEMQKKDSEISNLQTEIQRLRLRRQKIEEKESISFPKPLTTKQIQIALKNAGFYKGEIDGKVGVQTKEAIKAFQQANGLRADGIAGAKTQEKLIQYLTQ